MQSNSIRILILKQYLLDYIVSSFFRWTLYPFIELRLIGLSVDKRAIVPSLEYYCEDIRTYEHNRQTYVWQTIANCCGTECFQLVSFYVLVMFKFTHCWPYFMSILVMKFTELSKRVQRHFSKYWNLIKQSAKHTHTHTHLQRREKRACERGRRPAKGQQHWTHTHTHASSPSADTCHRRRRFASCRMASIAL